MATESTESLNHSVAARKVEFRIPISPTEKFFSLVRFYNFALRRLPGPQYRDARLLIVVGDHCDLDAVRRANAWSEDFPVAWERTPDDLFDEFSWVGTGNWRFAIPTGEADVIVLADADTVLLRDIDPLLLEMPVGRPAVRGHMAHLPPPLTTAGGSPTSAGPEFWPRLFQTFDLPWPATLYQYSLDMDNTLPRCPAYFNFGFVAMNPAAVAIFAAEVTEITRRVIAAAPSPMCCQMAATLLAHRAGLDIAALPAAYNAANDSDHFRCHGLTIDQVRVLHFLRAGEIDREQLQPHLLDDLLSRSLTNPANVALQSLAREYRESFR